MDNQHQSEAMNMDVSSANYATHAMDTVASNEVPNDTTVAAMALQLLYETGGHSSVNTKANSSESIKGSMEAQASTPAIGDSGVDNTNSNSNGSNGSVPGGLDPVTGMFAGAQNTNTIAPAYTETISAADAQSSIVQTTYKSKAGKASVIATMLATSEDLQSDTIGNTQSSKRGDACASENSADSNEPTESANGDKSTERKEGNVSMETYTSGDFDKTTVSATEHPLGNIPVTVKPEFDNDVKTADTATGGGSAPTSTDPASGTTEGAQSANAATGSQATDSASTPEQSLTKSGKLKVKKSRRRGSAWCDDETEFLMEIWARQAEIYKDKGTEESATCAPVYRLIAREMASMNWDKTWVQCKTRIHTLKRAYKITKDEINSGASTITYCRHFDNLGIIHGDNPDISPIMLANSLEEKRKMRELENKPRMKIPVKRKLIKAAPPAKKPALDQSVEQQHQQPQQGNTLPSFSTFERSSKSALSPNSSSNTSPWFSPTSAQGTTTPAPQGQSILQRSLSTPISLASPYHSLGSSSLQQTPSYTGYQSQTTNHSAAQLPTSSYPTMQEVNNNQLPVKDEKPDITFHEHSTTSQTNLAQNQQAYTSYTAVQNSQFNTPSHFQQPTPQKTTPRHNKPDDLERMRLNVELKRLDVERNKIEMEERQRREERDHQYRMMQLLLFGLGQQNISQLLTGHGSEVAHAHATDLSRALENGLVPGGQQIVNEKGLSFSEL